MKLGLGILLVALLGLSAWSCGSKVEESLLKTIKIDPKDKQEVLLSDIASNVEFIVLETTEDNLISRIVEIDHNDKFIFISDLNSLYQFSSDGSFIKKLGTNGQGPGEFISIRSMAVDWKRKYIYLATVGKLICLDFEGHLVKEVKLTMLDGLNIINGKLSVLRTAMGLPSDQAGMSNTVTFRIEVSDNLMLGDTTVVRSIVVTTGQGTIMPAGMSFISEADGEEFVYFPVPYQESLVRDTLYQIVDHKLVPDTKLDYGIKDKMEEGFAMYNMLRSKHYLIASYGIKGTSGSTLIHLPTATVYSVKGGFQDDMFGTGEAKLTPWDSQSDQFYFIKEAYDLEGIIEGLNVEGNPYIFITQLKN